MSLSKFEPLFSSFSLSSDSDRVGFPKKEIAIVKQNSYNKHNLNIYLIFHIQIGLLYEELISCQSYTLFS
jgi:hypothetical protein